MAVNKIEALLKNTICQAVNDSGIYNELASGDIIIDIPKDNKNGDYATNVAMQLTRVLKQNPRGIAQTIIEHMNLKAASIEKVEIAGPGFINFFMKKDVITNVLKEVLLEKNDYGKSDFGKQEKYNIEYVSANPTGELHLGHARGAALGDSISRIMTKAGFDVTREYYVNDAGAQISNLASSLIARYHQAYGKDYPMPEDGYHGKDVKAIAALIKEEVGERYLHDESKETFEFFKATGVKYEMERLKEVLRDFRVEFDHWFSETTLYKENRIEPTIEKLKQKGHTYEKDGALWLQSTKFGDDKDRVLVKSDGSYTYLTPDISYHLDKLSRGYDKLVDLLGADHHGYIGRMKASLQALGYDADTLSIDIIQMVRLIQDGQEVKMSKRTGNAVTIRDLIEDIGVDAARYFFVSKAGNTMFDFDLSLAGSQTNDNPVYYAQYAHARMCSIELMAETNEITIADSFDLVSHPKEIELIKYINEFRNVIIDSAENRAPHKITNFIQKLAQLFHSFYAECKVVDKENVELSAQRLAVVKATKITLKNALELVGVSAPEKM